MIEMEEMPLSQRWCSEGEISWFMSLEGSFLFEVNMSNSIVRLISRIPEKDIGWSCNPTCLKHDKYIYCFPDTGMHIWKYDLVSAKWEKITIVNPKNERLSIYSVYYDDKAVWFLTKNGCEINKLDFKTESITQVSVLSNDTSESVLDFTYEEEVLYCLSNNKPLIHCIDINTSDSETLHLPCSISHGSTVSVIKDCIFFTDEKKAIHKYNINDRSVVDYELDDSFGRYSLGEKDADILLDCKSKNYGERAFVQSVVLNGKIWFVPYRTNHIVYYDSATDCIYYLHIPEEDETNITAVYRIIYDKYRFCYVKDERYLGLFSFKTERILELDTECLTYQYKSFRFKKDDLKEYRNAIDYIKLSAENDEYNLKSMIDELVHTRRKMFDRLCDISEY